MIDFNNWWADRAHFCGNCPGRRKQLSDIFSFLYASQGCWWGDREQSPAPLSYCGKSWDLWPLGWTGCALNPVSCRSQTLTLVWVDCDWRRPETYKVSRVTGLTSGCCVYVDVRANPVFNHSLCLNQCWMFICVIWWPNDWGWSKLVSGKCCLATSWKLKRLLSHLEAAL